MFIQHNVFAFFWAVIILVISIIPISGTVPFLLFGVLPIDTAIHLLLYSTLVFILIVGFIKQYSFVRLRYSPILFAVLFTLIYGMIIEVLQGTVILARSFEVRDILANFIGCLIGTTTYYLIYYKL